MKQLELRPAPATRGDQIFNAFADFHRDHPDIWKLFERFTFEAIAAGRQNYGATAVLERIRWEVDIRGGGDVKINNNFKTYYARMFHAKHPEHGDFFRTRFRTSERKPAVYPDVQVFDSGPAGSEDDLAARLEELACL